MTDSAPASALEFHSVSKQFDEHVVLDGVSLSVAPGERIAIMGPSGSGKTTLLRLAMTLETLTSGSITVNGRNFDSTVQERRNRQLLRRVRDGVGMVFQHFNLFENLSARENITLALRKVKGQPPDAADATAERLLASVGLAEKADSYPRQLSGGQAQRVAIARAIAQEPSVLLFDEPTSALDPELVGEVLTVIRQVALNTNAAVAIVTHEVGFAAEIADRMIFMEDGKIVEQGPPSQLLESPKEKRTAEFLGSVMG